VSEVAEPGSLTINCLGKRTIFETGRTVVIGRAADCEVVVVDTRVSRYHVELVGKADGWYLHDRDSANGIWADGDRRADGRIPHRLTLRLGHPEDGPVLDLSVAPPIASAPDHSPADTSTADLAELSELGLTGELPEDADPPREPIKLRDGLTIGRDTCNDLVLTDLLVSRRHARLSRSPGGLYRVKGLGATNRTFVNGAPADGPGNDLVLHDGDMLTVGRTRMLRVGERLYPLPPLKQSGLDISDLNYRLDDGRTLISGLTWTVRGAQLVAVIGPSGAGKSTLLRLLAGRTQPTTGEIRYHDADVTTQAEIRTMIGLVPQQTVAHGRLRVADALRYAAELRLPHDIPAADRARRVNEVMGELGLAEHRGTRVDRLSGGQQRRLAIGFELLTRPSMLLLDEPTSGLDPALSKHVMQLLRTLSEGGRQVIVTTHDLTHLDLFDRVLVLAPGGRKAFLGLPGDLAKRFGETEWADIYERLSGEAADVARGPRPSRARHRLPAADLRDSTVRRRVTAQTLVVVRRQLRLLAADRAYVAFQSGLPVLLALLALTVPGGQGFGAAADPQGSTEAARILVVLLVGAAFMGMAAATRDLVAERGIYLHERAAGLLPESYLFAKLAVFGCVAVLQSAVLVGLLRLVRSGPASAVVIEPPSLEIVLAVAATAACCTALGLAASARVATTEQSTVPLVVTVMAQFVLCGGIFPMAGRMPLEQLSWVAPTRWGYAATASTVGLKYAGSDPLWRHTPVVWLGSLLALAALTTIFTAYARRVLRETRTNFL